MSNLQKVFTNTLTGKKYVQPRPTGVLKHYDGRPMITETDKEGIITYANRNFLEFNGFEKEELIGMPHSVLRHPETPEGLYKAMWKIISQKKVWRGYLKNLAKDGSSYWALVYIQPKLDENGEIIGYVANRRDAYLSSIREAEEMYQKLQGKKHIDDPYFMRAELHHGDELATFGDR